MRGLGNDRVRNIQSALFIVSEEVELNTERFSGSVDWIMQEDDDSD
jgi:hypothetical protein